MADFRIRGHRAIHTQPDIYMSTHKENRFIREVETATQHNPNIDMELINEWQKIVTMLEKILTIPEKANGKEQSRLQPIPLKILSFSSD